jgi:glycosyltransferase involved in cell wall biosynthesis
VRVLWISKASVTASYRKKLVLLSRLGVEIAVVTGDHWGAWQFEETPADREITIYRLPQPLSGRNHFHWYRQLALAIREFSPDLIHLDEEHYSFVSFQAGRLAYQYRIPFVFQTWQNILKHYPPPFSQFESYVFDHAQAGIAGTAAVRSVLLQKKFSKPVYIIPLGVDTDVFHPDPDPSYRQRFRSAGRWAIGFVGRLVPEKGVMDLAHAVIPLLSVHPDWHWMIAGAGPLEPALRQAIAQQSTRVEIWPWLATEDMAKFMNALDVLVVPSRTTPQWKEQFGRVLIEAMAVKLPIIAYRSGEIPHVVEQAGLLVPEGDIASLSHAIERLYLSSDLQASLRIEGFTRVLNNFSQEHVAHRLVDLYQTLL